MAKAEARLASARNEFAADDRKPFCTDCVELCRNPGAELPLTSVHFWRTVFWVRQIRDVVVSVSNYFFAVKWKIHPHQYACAFGSACSREADQNRIVSTFQPLEC